jgi:hypothetical protein
MKILATTPPPSHCPGNNGQYVQPLDNPRFCQPIHPFGSSTRRHGDGSHELSHLLATIYYHSVTWTLNWLLLVVILLQPSERYWRARADIFLTQTRRALPPAAEACGLFAALFRLFAQLRLIKPWRQSHTKDTIYSKKPGKRDKSGVQRVADTSAHGGEFIANRALCHRTGPQVAAISAGWSRRGSLNPEPTAYKAPHLR